MLQLRKSRPLAVAARVRRRLRASARRSLATDALSPHDVVIVGGGPAGLALAAAIGSLPAAKHSLKVALVEAADLSRVRGWNPGSNEFSNRVSSITNSSQGFLRNIGAWQFVDEARTSPIEAMQVWDGISDSRIYFSGHDAGSSSSEMARLTENLNLQRALLRRIETLSDTITIIDNTKVNSISSGEGSTTWPVVSLSSGQSLQARLLIGADGFNSPVRSFANIESYGWAYPTHAVVATMHHPASNGASSLPWRNTVAYQRFLPTGPLAFLPLTQDISSLVWSTTPQLAAILRSIDPDALSKLVNSAFRLPEISIRYLHSVLIEREASHGIESITPAFIADEIKFREDSHSIGPDSPLSSSDFELVRVGVPPVGSEAYPPLVTSIQRGTQASFPLKLSHARSYIGEGTGARTALVGDAAHTVHPLAGQGLNMGLADAEALSRTIEKAISLGGDIGSYTALLPYHMTRYTPNHAMLSATDKLHKIYRMTNDSAVWARSVGLEVLNELGPIKGAIMGVAGADKTDGGLNSGPSAAWGAAASGVEAVSGSIRIGRAVLEGLGGVVAGLAQNTLRNLSK